MPPQLMSNMSLTVMVLYQCNVGRPVCCEVERRYFDVICAFTDELRLVQYNEKFVVCLFPMFVSPNL